MGGFRLPTRQDDDVIPSTMMPRPQMAPGMIQHPMHAMIAPIGAPPPDLPPMSMSGPAPDVSGMSQNPSVAKKMSPLEEEEQHEEQRLMGDYKKDADPYGSPDNHPGILGKFLHGLSVATGGSGRRQMEEGQIGKQLETTEDTRGKVGLEGAQARNENETADLAPGKAASEEGLQGAQAGESTARAGAIANPPDTTPELGTYRSLVKMGMSPSEALQEVEKDKALGLKPTGAEHISVLDDSGQPVEANYDPTTRQTTAADGKVIKNPRPIPAPAAVGGATFVVPDPNTPGGGILQKVLPGGKVAPGAQTPGGVNTENTPTTQMRNTAQRAELVHSMVPEVIADIDKNQDALGPMMGRWNDFMQGKVGTDNPAISQLRADLLLMSSSVALAHAQGRLPENLREEFDKLINAPQQTPDNLKAVINEVDKWMVQNQNIMQGRENGGPQGNEPQRPANVPDGYQFNAKGKKGAGWYAPTAK